MYKILCCDGGGIKGALSARILENALKECPHFLDNVNMFAGTSTGGILAAGLDFGLKPRDLVQLYKKNGSEIFTKYADKLGELGDGITKPLYTNENLKKILATIFESNPLTSLQKTIVINTFKLDYNNTTWLPIQLTNFSGDTNKSVSIVDALLRTSAAPVYFPSYQGYIDGGVFANNPNICAIANAIDPEKGNISLDEIELLSIGTGFTKSYISDSPLWGGLEWINPAATPSVPLLNILMGGVSSIDSYNSEQILKNNQYFRVTPELDENYGMDDWEHVDYFINAADEISEKYPKFWQSFISWLNTNYK